jgi:hypothetical protein
MLFIERVATSIIRNTELSVSVYLDQISKEQDEVDACTRLVETECMLMSISCLFLAETQYSTAFADRQKIGDGVQDIQNGLRSLTLGKMSSICLQYLAFANTNAFTDHQQVIKEVKSLREVLSQVDDVMSSTGKSPKGFFMVPYGRNPQFVGRHSYLKDLSSRLERGDRHNRVALVGLGGIG